MDKIASENLFLLEFLVDRVQLDSSAGRDVGDMTGNTCVSVQFLDNAPLDICEDDFNPKRDYKRESDNLKSGKSCLFSLTAHQAAEAVNRFDVLVQVFKKNQPGEKIQVGNSLISIVNLFNELIRSISMTNGSNQSPSAKTLKDNFKITNASGQTIGDINIYIRISCFGKLIVTQFQMNLEDKSVLFKDKEGHSLYRYKKVDSRRGTQEGADGGYSGGAEGYGGGGRPNFPPCAQTTPAGPPSAQQFNSPCVECASMAQNQASSGGGGCYQEIGACMGGKSLTIRVHKDKNKPDQSTANDNTSNTASCSCAAGGGGGASSGGPHVSYQGDTNFSMRSGNEGNSGVASSPISFKMGSCQIGPGSGQTGNVNIVPPICTAPDGTKYTELSDPNKEIFILRIGKKDEGVEQNNNVELELTTPRGPEPKCTLKPQSRKASANAQLNDEGTQGS